MVLLARVFRCILFGRAGEFLSCLGGPCCLEAGGKPADCCGRKSLSLDTKQRPQRFRAVLATWGPQRSMHPTQGVHEFGRG